MALIRQLRSGAVLARSVMAPFERPDRLPRLMAAMAPWGASLAGLVAGSAARYPDRIAVRDADGATSYREPWRRSQAIAAGLQARGVGPGTGVGLLARNRLGFVEALVAVAATGADLVLLNTGFAGPQLADVVEHEGVNVIVHDDDFTDVVTSSGVDTCIGEDDLADMTRSGTIAPRRQQGAVVILTSGTTGRPKGAARSTDPSGIEGVAAVLDRIPLKLGDTQVIAAPLFHAWGLSHLLLGLTRCTTNVLARRFDPAQTLSSLSVNEAEVLIVVPVMLKRILALPAEVLARHPTPDLRVIASSGSALGSQLTTDVLDHFGPVLYNLYGSTEVAVATIAGPDDLVQSPDTAGRVASGVRVEILDERLRPVASGASGRVFVGGAGRFDGYTDGGRKEEHDGLLSSGDIGFFRDGLLFIEGRDDDMIVSGGENVFPSEVEDLLHRHAAIADAAVVGVDDDEFGQALAAYVVHSPGNKLTKRQVRDHVRDHLARHKVPRDVTFVDELPRNATGKLLRRQLGTTA